MDFSDRFRQCEQAFRDPNTLEDAKALSHAVVELQKLMEAIQKDIARLESERDAISGAQQNHEKSQHPISDRLPDEHSLSAQESLLCLCLRLFRDQTAGSMEDCEAFTTTPKSPTELKQQLQGLGPIVRLLHELARPCQILRQLSLEDENYFSELERTLALDRDARQRILARTAGAV